MFKNYIAVLLSLSIILSSCSKGNDIGRVSQTNDSPPPLTDSQDSTDAEVESLYPLTEDEKSDCSENPYLSHCPCIELSTQEQKRACADSCLKYPTKPYCNINLYDEDESIDNRKQDKPQSSGWSTKTWVIGTLVIASLVVVGVAVVWYVYGGRAYDKMLGIDRTINSYPVKFHMWISNLFRRKRHGFKPITIGDLPSFIPPPSLEPQPSLSTPPQSPLSQTGT
ncbi:MAG: hypothetical protein LE168_05355, partial [Endomicrobium sp.]|nr:hypothetical protein [Endomicrobium sp.]